MGTIKNYLKLILTKNIKHTYFCKNLCLVILNLEDDKFYALLPFLDKDCYFYYFAYNFREKLYKVLDNVTKLKELCNQDHFKEFTDNILLTEKEKIFLQKLYTKLQIAYNLELENYVLNNKIINCKQDLVDSKYAYFKHKIQLCDGSIYELKDVMFKHIKGKKYDSKTVSFLEKKYSKELKICKFYLTKKVQN